ncbi:hypothetical protein L596_008912 [Steinernema carpocapsae]|uniref:Secreted protein n=1 Tax=Steinernema carpocapsae TaxID=34508 RepID=A0A4U5PEN6_STECR|nr:hypothetical protein L596_008912 [Steinernema carpocapsae]
MRLGGLFVLSVLCLLPAALASCDQDYVYLEYFVNGLRSNIDSVLEKSCDAGTKKKALKAFEDGLVLLKPSLECSERVQLRSIDSNCNALERAYQINFLLPLDDIDSIAFAMCQERCPNDLSSVLQTLADDLTYVRLQ